MEAQLSPLAKMEGNPTSGSEEYQVPKEEISSKRQSIRELCNDDSEKYEVDAFFKSKEQRINNIKTPDVLPSVETLLANHFVHSEPVSSRSSMSAEMNTNSFVINQMLPMEFTKDSPYSKLINRSRRTRKGRAVSTKNPGRTCGWCNSQTTPEWRNGPENITLCNACGLQYRNQLKIEQADKKKNSIKNLLN